MKTNVSLKHYLFTTRGTTGPLPIYLRITIDRKKAECHTGFTCTLKEWNADKQLTKHSLTINADLSSQKANAFELVKELEKENKLITPAILKNMLLGKDTVKTYLLKYFADHIEEIKIKAEIKDISLNKYNQSYQSLVAFIKAKYKLDDLSIDQITFDFINAYDLHLRQVQGLHKNTVNKYHSRLRTLLLKAQSHGLINTQPYSRFKLVSQKTERTFLNQEELNKITELDLTHNPSLDRVKDIFLFSCYTGVRFKDAQNLTEANLTTHNKKPFLRYMQDKTCKAVDVPLLHPASKIIEKYKNLPEREVLKTLLPKISNQKVNAYLKVIADLAGIATTLTHHVARHTFATTVLLNNNVPMEDVSRMLGHSSMKTTSIYGKITQSRLSNAMQKVERKLFKGEKK